jgi:hypothetical protein
MNEKGGMNNKEFVRYIDNSIIPLSPALEDTPGKRILIKVNSGRGCNGRDLLHKCQFRGVCIYPGLLNSTSMKQETDINYSLLKGVIWRNLAKIATTCYSKGITMSLGTPAFGLIVYGGVCPDYGIMLENTWSEVGVVPFTKRCLMNKKVHHDGTERTIPTLTSSRTSSPRKL